MRKVIKSTALSFLVLVIVFSLIKTSYPSGLVITIDAKKSYNLGEDTIIDGSLTLDGLPVPNGLVAIQINTPRGDDPEHRFVMRTLTTGSEPAGPWSVEILEVYACDIDGYPLPGFRRGGAAGFKITVRNNGASPQEVLATVNLYDPSGIPFGALLMINQTIQAYETLSSRNWLEGLIPDDAALGTAHLYAVAMTDWPQYGGIAWCPEKSSTFAITLDVVDSVSSAPGNFSLPFRLSANGGLLGNYTLHATSYYGMSYATNLRTFEAVLIADVNQDGIVDMADLSAIIDAFMSTSGSGNWNPAADINRDETVDMSDISLGIEDFLKWGRY